MKRVCFIYLSYADGKEKTIPEDRLDFYLEQYQWTILPSDEILSNRTNRIVGKIIDIVEYSC